MEPGSVPGAVQFFLTTIYGRDFEGGHVSQRGTAADGQSVSVPTYRHEVSLDYARVELEMRYTADMRYPLSQRTLSEGEAFKQGPTFIVTIGGRLR